MIPRRKRPIDTPQLGELGPVRLLDGPSRQKQHSKVELTTGGALGTPGPFTNVLSLSAADQTAETFTIFLSGPDALALGVASQPVVGRLEWALGGTKHEGFFDWIRGTRLVVAGSRVDLEAAHEGGLTPVVQVSAHASYGAAAAGYVVPQRTAYVGAVLAGASSAPIPVPPFAHAVRVFPFPIGTSGGWMIQFNDANGTPVAEVTVPTRSFGLGPGPEAVGQLLDMPLPNDVRSVTFVNGNNARSAVRFVFSLSL